jgi:hypothetical protein
MIMVISIWKTALPIPLLKERMVIQLLVSLYIQGKISY